MIAFVFRTALHGVGVVRRRLGVNVPLLLFVLALGPALCSSECGNNNTQVEVHNFVSGNGIYDSMRKAILTGFSASLHSQETSESIKKGINIEKLSTGSGSTSVDLEKLGREVNDDDGKGKLPILLGPVGDVGIQDLVSKLEKLKLVAFSPLSGSSQMRRGWNQHLYFITASPAAEMVALVRYAVSQLRLKRLGFMYLKNVSYGDEEYQLMLKVMAVLGRELYGVFELESFTDKHASDKKFKDAWSRFAIKQPQGVIVFGSPVVDTLKFIEKWLSDAQLKGGYLFIPSMLQYVMTTSWKDKGALKGIVHGKVILTGTNPLASEDDYAAIQRFWEDMGHYLKSEKGKHDSVFAEKEHKKNTTEGELMVHGWIAGEVLWRALGSREALKNKTALIDSLYSQRRYVIDDLVIGDFGGDCKGLAGERGAVCNCNQGGNVVYMKTMEGEHNLQPLKEGIVSLASSRCHTNLLQLYAPLSGVMFRVESDPVASRVTSEIYNGAVNGTGKGQLGHSDRFFLHTISSETPAKALEEDMKGHVVTAVFGVADEKLLSTPNVTFVDPVYLAPRLRHPERNVFYLSPTIEQQIFIIVKYIVVNISTRRIRAIVRGGDPYGIKSVLRKTLWGFFKLLRALDIAPQNESIKEVLNRKRDCFIFGLIKEDVAVIAKHLEENKDRHVFVPFLDVAVLYHEFERVFKNHEGRSRLFFATSLPHWAEENSSSETVQKFHKAVPNKTQWTPLGLLGFATARAMESVLLHMGRVTAEGLADSIYTQSVIMADDMLYGPFEDRCPVSYGFAAKDCAVNYGATRISVWSMARALNASVPPTVGPVDPSMQYFRVGLYLSEEQLTGTIVGTVFSGIALFVFGVFTLRLMRRSARNNVNAPKEAKDPVTLLFTDIESSTAQWAAHPELMPDAVATHHRLIRALITRYQGYEVKTVGDSFMIACKNPFSAALIAHDLQRCFLNNDWKTSVFDETYRELERQHAEDAPDYTPPTARLDPAVYRKLWSGLRVRVGIHTGLCDIRYDEVTKGYDYYGRTPNMAARTESVANGGQVLLTRATYMSLSAGERNQFNVVSLGSIPLRGVPEPVELYQLNAVPGRTFGPLRLDCELIDDDEISICSDGSSIACGLGEAAQRVAACIDALLGVFPVHQRKKVLAPFCNRWRVSVSRVPDVWDEETCKNITRLIAVRVGRVVDFGGRNNVPSLGASLAHSSFCSPLASRVDVRPVSFCANEGEATVRGVQFVGLPGAGCNR